MARSMLLPCICSHLLLLIGLFLSGGASAEEQFAEQDMLGDLAEWQAMLSEFCSDTSPDALTNFLNVTVDYACLDVPYGGDDDASITSERTLRRCYYTFVPDMDSEPCKNANINGGNGKLPLVLDVHGVGVCPLMSASYTGWFEKAKEECFVVVWPAASSVDEDGFVARDRCWNLPGFLRLEGNEDNEDVSDGTDATNGATTITTLPCCCYLEPEASTTGGGMSLPPEEPNDPLFLRMVIDAMVNGNTLKPSSSSYSPSQPSVAIDASRVYMAGHSNGCIASLAMAAMHSDAIAAVCCHAGTVVTPFPKENNDGSSYDPVPVWLAHGLKDPIVPFDGSTFLDVFPFGPIGFMSTMDGVRYIGDMNGCDGELLSQEIETAADDEDGSSAIAGVLYKRMNCANGADVELVALNDVGHSPYQGSETTIDTTSMAWDFCSSHTKGGGAREETPKQQHQEEEKEQGGDTEEEASGGLPAGGAATIDGEFSVETEGPATTSAAYLWQQRRSRSMVKLVLAAAAGLFF